MDDLVVKRIQRELRDVMQSEETEHCGIKVELIDNNFYKLKCEIKGPPDTPYEGGIFKLEIELSKHYPFKPPSIRFETKIWHPNITSIVGFVCLDILQDKWSASLTLRTILLSIQLLLSTPELKDPQDYIVARQYNLYPEIFNSTARHWTNVYAGGPSKNESFDDKIRKIMNLGFSENRARSVLSSCNWDLEEAINEIEGK